MIELKAVPHDTNLAHITITRLGDDRSTRYRVTPSGAKQEPEAPPLVPAATRPDITTEYRRWKDGNFVKEPQEG